MDAVTQLNSNNQSTEDAFDVTPYEALHFDLVDEKVMSSYGRSDGGIASDVHHITQCVKGIIQSKYSLFRLKEMKVDRRVKPLMSRIEMSKLGEYFLKCLKMDIDRIIDKYPSIGKHNRYFGLFHDAVMREVEFENGSAPFAIVAREEWLSSSDWKEMPRSVLTQYVRPLNDVVEEIIQQGRGDEFKDWLNAIQRQPDSNADRLWSLIEACLSANHHISVLRFDTGYAQYYCDSELSGEQAITYEDIRSHRRALRRFLKRDLSKMLPPGACKGMGFAIKLEYGLDKGYHFHVIVILNGDVVCRHAAIADMICDSWNRYITGGKGGSYNCFRSTYVKPGIGSVRYNDEQKLKTLKDLVVPYVTKPDFYVGMAKPEAHRSFWKSQPPMITARAGRKRSKRIEACQGMSVMEPLLTTEPTRVDRMPEVFQSAPPSADRHSSRIRHTTS